MHIFDRKKEAQKQSLTLGHWFIFDQIQIWTAGRPEAQMQSVDIPETCVKKPALPLHHTGPLAENRRPTSLETRSGPTSDLSGEDKKVRRRWETESDSSRLFVE